MCRYYLWPCKGCNVLQESVAECPPTQSKPYHRCQRTVDPLPLPRNAPPITCGACGLINGPPAPNHNQNQVPCQPGIIPSQHCTPPARSPLRVGFVPPPQDLFWLPPALRLPDLSQTLARYATTRGHVLQTVSHDSKDHDGKMKGWGKEGRRGSQGQAAWQQLKEALTKE